MNQSEVAVLLRQHILSNHDGSQKKYAKHCGCSEVYLSYVMNDKKPPTKPMLNDLGLVKRTFVSYVSE